MEDVQRPVDQQSDQVDDPLSYWQATTTTAVRSHSDVLPTTVDVAIVGGGLLGTAALYWLSHAGVRAVLIERGPLAAGATGRNSGVVGIGAAWPYRDAINHLGHEAACAIWALTLDNRAVLRRVLADEAIACDYREPGSLSLTLSEEQLAHVAKNVAALRTDGFPAQLLDRQEVQELIGTPLGPTITGGLFTPENGLIDPARLVLGLANAARRAGAQICIGTTVHRLEPNAEGVLLRTTRGCVHAGAAIIAINAWTSQLVPELAGLIRPVRGQMLAYAPIARVFPCATSTQVTPTGEYWQQAMDGMIVLGGCRAIAVNQDVGEWESRPTAEVQAALEQVFPSLFPLLDDLCVVQRWAGLMAFTPDYLPIVDHVSALPNTWVVGGFCGHGMPFGIRIGQLLAEAVTTSRRPAALTPLRRNRPTLLGG